MLFVLILFSAGCLFAQAPDSVAGRAAFESHCMVCHGSDGNGGEHAPSVLPAVAAKTDAELNAIIVDGVAAKGMPGFKQLPEAERVALVDYMRVLQQHERRRRGFQSTRLKVKLTDGTQMEGLAISKTRRDLALRTADQRLQLLRKAPGDTHRRVTSQADWTSMHGGLDGNR
ncbi:MAG: cytochrome c [Acidobacteria bacterium]|nr:cytochrome c [Acidobacteriota bacterium]